MQKTNKNYEEEQDIIDTKNKCEENTISQKNDINIYE